MNKRRDPSEGRRDRPARALNAIMSIFLRARISRRAELPQDKPGQEVAQGRRGNHPPLQHLHEHHGDQGQALPGAASNQPCCPWPPAGPGEQNPAPTSSPAQSARRSANTPITTPSAKQTGDLSPSALVDLDGSGVYFLFVKKLRDSGLRVCLRTCSRASSPWTSRLRFAGARPTDDVPRPRWRRKVWRQKLRGV
jgi:hypothetical protein